MMSQQGGKARLGCVRRTGRARGCGYITRPLSVARHSHPSILSFHSYFFLLKSNGSTTKACQTSKSLLKSAVAYTVQPRIDNGESTATRESETSTSHSRHHHSHNNHLQQSSTITSSSSPSTSLSSSKSLASQGAMASSSQDVPTTASSSNDGLHSSSTAAPAFGTPVISSSRRRDGRPIPHDILLPIARYLGDMCKAGDHDARLTLASMMRVSSDAFDAAARTLYAAVTVSRDSFSQVFGGNDTKKSNMFGHPITFPTRASVVRKLGLFQYTRHLHLHDLPSEQAVDDLIDAWRVACSQPASGVSCREALHGNLFPRIECVSFGPGVFLNHHSAPPLGPENGGLHRFLSFLRRESSPKHMCMAYPTPAQVMAYQQEHPAAERSSGWNTPAPIADPAPGPLGVGAGPPVLLAGPVVHESRLSRADEAAWPEILARMWRIKTITIHNMRFSRAAARCLVKLPCEQLRVFALDSICGHGICAERECFHSDTRWGRAGTMLHTMARDDKDVARFTSLEIVNVGAGFPLTCNCSAEYSNAVAWLKSYLRDRADEAPWSLSLPHWSQAAPCQCCGAAVAPTGDTGEGSARGIIHPNRNCVSGALASGHICNIKADVSSRTSIAGRRDSVPQSRPRLLSPFPVVGDRSFPLLLTIPSSCRRASLYRLISSKTPPRSLRPPTPRRLRAAAPPLPQLTPCWEAGRQRHRRQLLSTFRSGSPLARLPSLRPCRPRPRPRLPRPWARDRRRLVLPARLGKWSGLVRLPLYPLLWTTLALSTLGWRGNLGRPVHRSRLMMPRTHRMFPPAPPKRRLATLAPPWLPTTPSFG